MSVATRSGRIGGALGLLSLALLAASIKWAHHWGGRADLLVACWGAAVVGTLWFSARSVRAGSDEVGGTPRLAKLGFWLAAVSLLALVAAGIAAAGGMDPAGACGGG